MRVFWDTNLLIYLIEDYGDLTRLTIELWNRMRVRGDVVVTSTLALGEAMVLPRRMSAAAAEGFRERVHRFADVQPFDGAAVSLFAEIRLNRSIGAPDAVHLACAVAARVDLFVTNDDRLSRKVVPGVPILSSLRSVPI